MTDSGSLSIGGGLGIVTVGDELLTGRITDSHSSYLSQAFVTRGYDVTFHFSVGDRPGDLSGWLRRLNHEGPLMIVGGLGPTEDDRTRSEVAAALGVDLEFDPSSWKRIQNYLANRSVTVSENNRHQAFFPRGATVVENPHGTAPAFRVSARRGTWWVLPGVPRELHALLEEAVLPELMSLYPRPARTDDSVALRFFAVPEARLDEWLLARLDASERDRYHICVSDGETFVEVPARDDWEEAATIAFGPRFLGSGPDGLAGRVLAEATRRGAQLATAESCTGGLVSKRLVDMPGASAAFAGGWVAYSNDQKRQNLGVPSVELERDGAVSASVACSLARAARDRGGAPELSSVPEGVPPSDRRLVVHGLGISGVAGPGGGTEDKPVGTTYIAVANPHGVWWRRYSLPGNRDRIRSWAASWGLFALWLSLTGGEDLGQARLALEPGSSDGFGAGARGWRSESDLDS